MSAAVLLTGASGFIGSRLRRALQARGEGPRCLLRHPLPGLDLPLVRGDLEDEAALRQAVQGVHTVFHCAGFAHAMGNSAQLAALHERINHAGSVRLGRVAAQAGVSRFVFLSSVKARGEPGEALADEDWPGEPLSPYGIAKWRAEQELARIAAASGMQLVVLRPVMVYGAGGRGNLERMARALRAGRFPPLPETGRRRSLVHVDDVVEALLLAAGAPAAAGRTYNLAHPRCVSGAQLQAALCHALGRRPPGWSVPAPLLRAAGRVGDGLAALGLPAPLRGETVERLLGAACHSAERIRRELGWQARVDLAEGLAEMCAEPAGGAHG